MDIKGEADPDESIPCDPLANWSGLVNALPETQCLPLTSVPSPARLMVGRTALSRYRKRRQQRALRSRDMRNHDRSADAYRLHRNSRRRRKCGKCFRLLRQNKRMRRVVKQLKKKVRRSQDSSNPLQPSSLM